MDRPDANLALALAQSLENLQRTGLRFAVRGTDSEARAWFTKHKGEFPCGPPALTQGVAQIEAVSASKTASPAGIEPVSSPPEKHSFSASIVQTPENWTGRSLKLGERLEVLARESAAASQCTQCPDLVKSRTSVVFGCGNAATKIVFVGDMPGREEDAAGQPFVGPAGQLLDKIISAMKLQREEVYLTNAINCWPPNRRSPTNTEVAHCKSFLEKQLEILRPEFIVCLGALAAQALLDQTAGIGKLRGRFHSYRDSRVVVTYHPSYLLKQPDAKRFVWQDMQMIMAAMTT